MKKALIKICENGNCFGSMFVVFEFGAAQLLDKCMNLLYNYNKNLYKANLPKEMLAIRFFQESDEYGTTFKVPAKIMYDSKIYVELSLNKYYDSICFDTDEKYGRIAIVRSDMEYSEENIRMSVEIDIKNNTIKFNDIGSAYSKDSYEDIYDRRVASLLNLEEEGIEYKNAQFTLKYFNILDDFYWFIVRNHEGFVLPTGNIFVPDM